VPEVDKIMGALREIVKLGTVSRAVITYADAERIVRRVLSSLPPRLQVQYLGGSSVPEIVCGIANRYSKFVAVTLFDDEATFYWGDEESLSPGTWMPCCMGVYDG
jgi:hypothetical protein